MSLVVQRFLASLAVLMIFQLSAVADNNVPQMSRMEAQIIKAVKFANGLEQKLWESKDDFTSRNQVFKHYRQGFSEEIAARMTDHTWSDTLGLKEGDFATLPPERVHIIKRDNLSATVYFETPNPLRDEEGWARAKYTVQQLRKENGRWLTVSATDTPKRPVAW